MPKLPLYFFQMLLLPDVLCCIFEILCFLFHQLAWRHPADSHNVTSVSSSSSCPLSKLSSPQPGDAIATAQDSAHLPIGQAQSNPASEPIRPLRDFTPQVILDHSALTQTSSVAQSKAPQAPNFDQSQHESLLVVPHHSQPPATLPQGLTDRKKGIFYQASNVSLPGAVLIDNNADNASININSSDKFMAKLLQETIPGAAFDSSIRDPPPRCHPGTRLAILQQCVAFIGNCTGARKIRWVVGAAGVGKSAIMQSIAEYPLASVSLRASIFFLVNGRSDGSKAIVTLAYQLAVQCRPYHQFIKQEIAHDPSLLQKSISVQFNKFIVEPFTHYSLLNCVGRVLIIIDGLDECDKSHTQRELLQLISNFCLIYPSSSIVWMIASRPEPHITSFFAQPSVKEVYENEEILVDSDNAREDVERFLHTELRKIQNEFSLHPRMHWPSVQDFWKLANASGGLFVYAHTVVKYIGDSDIGDPILQLNDVLQVIDAHPLANVAREEHPMALLDALYSRILSKLPTKAMVNSRKLLLALAVGWGPLLEQERRNFIVLCNWLGVTPNEAYAALRHLSSVLYVPSHGKAHMEELRPFHKSFIDYISDFVRSGYSPDIKHEARELYNQCTFRILEQAPDGIDVGDFDYDVGGGFFIGTLAHGPGSGNNISLTWPVDEEYGWDDNRSRLCVYKMAIASVAYGIRHGLQAFCTVFFIRLWAMRFHSFVETGVRNLPEVVFDKSRRHGFMEQGLLKQIPVQMLNFPHMIWETRLQFRRPATPVRNLADPWNSSCKHEREGQWEEGNDQAWSTEFRMRGFFVHDECNFCCHRLEYQLESYKSRLPDHLVSVLHTSAGISFVEFQFVDQDDGVSEWTYWLVYEFSEEERIQLGSAV